MNDERVRTHSREYHPARRAAGSDGPEAEDRLPPDRGRPSGPGQATAINSAATRQQAAPEIAAAPRSDETLRGFGTGVLTAGPPEARASLRIRPSATTVTRS